MYKTQGIGLVKHDKTCIRYTSESQTFASDISDALFVRSVA